MSQPASYFLIACTGGLESPFFVTYPDEKSARKSLEWKTARSFVNHPGERVDLLRIGPNEVGTIVTKELAMVEYDEELPW